MHARLIVLLLATLGGGCAAKVIPPMHPASPVAVYVTDYGRHSSLLLPTNDGHLIEYAYGDWDYYALSKYRWYIGATALFYSDASGLGRRILPYPQDEEALCKLLCSKRVLKLQIDQRKVFELLNDLDDRYHKHIDSLVYNKDQALYFVRDDSHYSVFHTCNQATADWLIRLGCTVEGWPILSNFELAQVPRPALVATPPPTTQTAFREEHPIKLSP